MKDDNKTESQRSATSDREPGAGRGLRSALGIALAGLVLLTLTCSQGGVIGGEAKPLNGGMAWCWVERNPDGGPSAIGVSFTEAMLSALPDTDVEVTLRLPPGIAVPPYDHVAVHWSAHGHMPDSLFGAPHFDVHFSLVSEAERVGVEPGPDTVSVPVQFQPRDFFSGVAVVPRMGVHWLDTLGEEVHNQSFTRNFIWGFYRGHMTFIEPMITLAYLRTRPDFSAVIKPPDMYEHSGYYPRRYHVKYSPGQKLYSVALEQLTFEEGGARIKRR